MEKYTPEQKEDIQKREKDAIEYLTKLQLTPACYPSFVNTGNDVFAVKLQPYLQDMKYIVKESPYAPKKD